MDPRAYEPQCWPQTIRVRPAVPASPATLADSLCDRPAIRVYLDAHDARVAAARLLTGNHDYVWAVRSVTAPLGEPLEVEVYVIRSGGSDDDFDQDAQAMRDIVQSIVDGESPRVFAGLLNPTERPL